MRLHILIIVCIIPCLVISFFIFYSRISSPNRLLKVGKQFLVINKSDNAFYQWNQMILKYLKFPLDHHYGSHTIVLLAVLYITQSGPILELGMGSDSSPLLHRLAMDQKRILISADSDLRWINYYSNYTVNNPLHKLKHVHVSSEMGIEWATSGLADQQDWTVVFIDHRPGPRRQFELMLYADRSDIVILHDTEKSLLYKYEKGLALYPYKYRFTKLKTYTDILSLKNETIIKKIRDLLESTSHYYYSNITLK
jgi:hypothetical protein